MKIAIDCRYLGQSGIGRYLSGILENLDYTLNKYVLIGRKQALDILPYNFKPIYCDISPYSVKGLFSFPVKEVNSCDAFLTPNFIIPFGIRTRIFSTIHDVIFFDYKDGTNSFTDYQIKKYFIKRALKKSKKVFTVSNFSKNRILAHFPKYEDKLVITGNAISSSLKSIDVNVAKVSNSLIYVGNIKKHKGLSVLKGALNILNADSKKYTLTIVGSKDNFRTSDKTNDILDRLDVNYTGHLNGAELVNAIAQSEFLIQPSFYEGFGIPPLESLYFETKPIISDIDVFKEVYGKINDVVFFKTGDSKSLAEKIAASDPKVNITKVEIDSIFSYAAISNIVLTKITQ